MLDYLISLFENAQDYSWEAQKASHAFLLCRMEQGEVKNYADKIDKIRRANEQRHLTPPTSSTNVKNRIKIQTNLCHVNILIKVLARLLGLMIPKRSHTNTFVQLVLPWVGRA